MTPQEQPDSQAGDEQAPAEALRQQITDIVYMIPTLRREAARNEIMELVTAYAATVAQDIIGEDEIEYSNLDGDAGYWEKHGRNGLRAKQRDRLAALQGTEEG